MGKSKAGKDPAAVPAKKARDAKKSTAAKSSGGGLDEIDSLFASKKRSREDMRRRADEEEDAARRERERRRRAREEEEADEAALRGTACTAAAKAPAALHERAAKLPSLSYTRSDVDRLNGGAGGEARDRWASDGLGGVFNGEGYTGRRDDGGQRVFKAHLMNREGFGTTADCPFDCDCCFI